MTRTCAMLLGLLLATGCGRRADDGDRRPRTIEKAPPVQVRAPGSDAIEYTVSFAGAVNHYIDVTATVPAAGGDTVELMMAVWTPGSYLVREYARHVETVTAATVDGAPLAISKVRKNRWRVSTGGADRVVVRYRVYAREMSVRTNFVDDRLAVLNGAATFMTLVGGHARPHDVVLELPDSYQRAVTALPAHPDGTANRFVAADYDTLVDSPIVLGSPTLHELEVEQVPHLLASFGGGKAWDSEQSATDVERLIATQLELWGVVPYGRYVFLNVLTDGRNGGGLEHKASTLMMLGRWMTRKRADYLRWLALVSHEFFHTWNGKRLRPAELGPFDYENEVYTRSLWVVEGITSYYDDLLLRRSGLMTQAEYLDRMSANINDLQSTPGRKVQPLALGSYDAWIKYYRGDENSVNSAVSYYTKGSVVAFVLDAEIRKRTFGKKSLDDVMRLAYRRYSGDTGYSPEQFRAVAEEIAGGSLADWWARYVDGTDELDYQPALDYFGLRFRPVEEEADDEDGPEDEADTDETPGWLGAGVDGKLTVTRVPRETPAHDAGLNVDDELIAIDGYRVRDLGRHLTRYRPGDEVVLTIARRGEIRQLPATLGEKPAPRWKLQIAADDIGARARREGWLGPEG